jgi:hypothetical protein
VTAQGLQAMQITDPVFFDPEGKRRDGLDAHA